MTYSLKTAVNGATVEREVEPRRRLVDFLREDLALTGTKVSCEVQVCGACTVLVDGEPVSACTYLAVDVDARKVTTIEGVAEGDQLSPVQQAFVEKFALQCGFCTPGFVLSVTALLEETPDPTDKQIVHYLDGNLCRCTGYAQIREAVHRAVELRAQEAPRG